MPTTSRSGLPDKLYKYRTPERIGDLNDLTIRITQPSAFNDPFEIDPSLTSIMSEAELDKHFPDGGKELMREVFEEMEHQGKDLFQRRGHTFDDFWTLLQAKSPDLKGLAAKVLSDLAPLARKKWQNEFGTEIGVVSLSEKHDDLLMWSHYAQNHQGFVIECDPMHSFFWQPRSQSDELCHLRQVAYAEERPRGSMMELGAEGLLLTKSAHWSYESEWRILFPVEDADWVLEGEDDEHPVYLKELPPDAISGVILGCRASDSLWEQVRELTSTGEPLGHATVTEATQSSQEFALEFSVVGDA